MTNRYENHYELRNAVLSVWAREVAEQLLWLVENHYQAEGA